MTSRQGSIPAYRQPFGIAVQPSPLIFFATQIGSPVVHQDTPALEKVRAGIGRLHPVPDNMRQGFLDHLPGMVRQPMNSVNVFTGLYLCRVEQLMVPPLVTLYQRGSGIRFAVWGPG